MLHSIQSNASHRYVYAWPVPQPAYIHHDSWATRRPQEQPAHRYMHTARLGSGMSSVSATQPWHAAATRKTRTRNAFKYGGNSANELVGYAALYRSR